MSKDKSNSKNTGYEIKKSLEHHDDFAEHPVYSAPGCGLASYSCLLLMFFLTGVGGLVVSSLALLQGQMAEDSYYVRAGNQVQTRRFKPMWEAKVIELGEIPILYHDESNDGTVACALMESSIVRVDGDNSWKIPYFELVDAVSENDGYGAIVRAIIQGPNEQYEQLPCYFEQSEGHGMFLEELKSQIAKSKETLGG